MPSPFPGVDPYLEAPHLWEDVHSRLANDISAQLQPQLVPHYIAALTPYMTYEDIAIAETNAIKPDVAVLERMPLHGGDTATLTMEAPFTTATALDPMTIPIRSQRIEVRAVGTDKLVTVIEILSPINKRIGSAGHEAYSRKRRDLLNSDVHLLELDLLRRGMRWPTRDALPDAPYFVFLSRANRRPDVEVWPLTFREPPTPMPELGRGETRWLDERLRGAGMR